MTFTREQRQTAYKKLPPEIQDLIMSNETTELIAATLKEAGLSEEQVNLADSEILYTLFCLQSLDDAINNISKLSGKSAGDLSKIRTVVEDEILSKYKIDIKEFVELNKKESSKTPFALEKPVLEPTKVPEIPPENLPVIEKGEVAHEVPHVEPTTDNRQPTTNQEQSKPQIETGSKITIPANPHYPGGKDPYREPLK